MIRLSVPLFLMATALGCGSDIDLQLDSKRGPATPADPAAEPPPEAPSAPPLGALAWSRTGFGQPGYVHDLVWTTEGGLTATVPMQKEDGNESVRLPLLTSHDPDGALDWEVEASSDEFLGRLSATEGGGVVVAVMPEWLDVPPGEPAGLDWYDEGALTASWRPAEGDTEDTLREVHAVQALPDGGVFWTGRTLSDDLGTWTPLAARLDPDRQLLWLVTVPSPNPDDGSSAIHDVALTADGDVVAVGSYEQAPPNDNLNGSSFVVRFAADGTEAWRLAFLGDAQSNGIAVAPSGNIVVAGVFRGSMTVGDLLLEDRPNGVNGHEHFVVELDPAGEPLRLNHPEIPAAIDSDEIGVIPNSMTILGEDVVLSGMYYTFSSDSPQLSGYYSASNTLDGDLVAEILFPVEVNEQPAGFGPVASDADAEGRLALGGSFGGRVDFGDGEVDSGEDKYGFAISLPFIAVFDPPRDEDVD